MMERPKWTLSEASKRTGASRSTLRRRLETGAFPHATQAPDGSWRVPIEDLLAAGFSLSTEMSTERAHGDPEGVHVDTKTLSDRVNELEIALSTERAQRLATEQIVDSERARADAAERNTQDLRTALRMIEATTTPTTSTAPPRRWWQR